jgi:DNA-binding transcriptional LysR family regulator
MNLNQFRNFYYAAKHLNFTRAAEELFISQPAITVQVKAFESFCGFRLFKKRGRKIWLTDEGRILFKLAQKVFALEKEIENTVDDLRKLKKGVLRIGTTKAYARYFMPSMLSSFMSNYPDIKVELNEGSSLDMTRSLLDFKNEVAIIAKAGDVPRIEYIPFSHEEMTVILAPNHPLLKGKPVHFKDLAAEPFIMKEGGSGTRRLVDQLFEKEGCSPNILMETSNTEFIKQLVQRGDGVSFLVKAAVVNELKEKKLAEVPLNGPTHYMDVSIAYLKGQPLSLSAKAFIDTLKTLRSGRNLSSPEGIGMILAHMLVQRRKGR